MPTATFSIRLRLTLDDDTVHDVTAGVADFLALEDRFDIDASTLAQRQRLVWLVFLGWSALARAKTITSSFDEFREHVVDLALEATSGEAEGDGRA